MAGMNAKSGSPAASQAPSIHLYAAELFGRSGEVYIEHRGLGYLLRRSGSGDELELLRVHPHLERRL